MIAKKEKTGQTNMSDSTTYQLEVQMSHAQMLKIRRTKQKTRKLLAGIAKRTKKLNKQNAKAVSADAQKSASP